MLSKLIALSSMHRKEYKMYKSNFFLFTLNRLVEVIVYIFVWQAIYNETGNAGGLSIDQMITYYVLVISLLPITTWGINEDMAHSIRNGQIQKELLSPVTYFQYYFGIFIGEMRFALIVAISAFIICNIFWTVILPNSFLNFIYAILLILLGMIILYLTQMIVGLIGFYTNSIWGMQILRKSIISIFSGMIAPLTLFPNWFQQIANLLPFKEIVYTPVYLYLGQVELNTIWILIIKQIIWIILLYIIAKAFFKHAVKKVTVNGG